MIILSYFRRLRTTGRYTAVRRTDLFASGDLRAWADLPTFHPADAAPAKTRTR